MSVKDVPVLSVKSKRDNFLSHIVLCLGVFLFLMLIRMFVIDFVCVDGTSMTPTLKDKQIVWVQKFGLDHIERYDIVLCSSPQGTLVKRVIGLPGDTVKIDDMGFVYVNDERLPDQYQWDVGKFSSPGVWTVGDNEVFLLCDNRENSRDSRYYGPFNKHQIKGKVLGQS